MYKLNVLDLFRNQFRFDVNTISSNEVTNQFFRNHKVEVVSADKPLTKMSLQGVPVWDYVKLLPKKSISTGDLFSGYEFPVECVVQADFSKKIVETEVWGRDGMIEELMGNHAWNINIKGFIINYKSNDYPEKEVQELIKACSFKDSELAVEGTFLNMLSIYNLSIHNIDLPPMEGYANVQSFNIQCKSQIPFYTEEQY